jgi:hypothetical protein
MNAIIRMLKRPRLRRLKGRDIIESIGFKILKPIASKIPPIIKVLIPSCRTSPAKANCVTYKANA